MHTIRKIISLFFLSNLASIAAQPCLFAQPSPEQPIKFDRVPSELGLSQNLISAILQDRKGFLWFGTKDGLNRFDGYEFTVYQHDAYDSTSLSDNFITALYEDSKDRIWVGTENGLNLFDRAREVFHRSLPDVASRNSVSHTYISGIVENTTESSHSEIWIATHGGGLNKILLPAESRSFAGAIYTHFRHDPADPNSLSRDMVRNPAVDEQGTVWVKSGSDIYRFARTQGQSGYQVNRFNPDLAGRAGKSLPDDKGNPDPFLLGAGRNGRIWIWATAGLFRWEAETGELKYYHLPRENPLDFAWTICEDRTGVVWIGFDGGLGCFDPSTGRYDYYDHEPGNPNSIPASGIGAIFEDAGGVLWLGSRGHGLFRYDRKAARFNRRGGPVGAAKRAKISMWRGSSLRAICETRDGALWLGSENRQFFHLDRTAGVIRQAPGRDWAVVFSMLQDKTGALWIGSGKGLYRMEWQDDKAGRIDYFKPEPGRPKSRAQQVYKVFEDRDSEIWIATRGHFSRLDRQSGRFEKFRYTSPDPGAVRQSVYTFVHQDRRGVFWLGTADGLLRFDRGRGSFKRYRNDPKNRTSLSHNVVRTICNDPFEPDKFLWLGTAGGGLNRFDIAVEKFTHFTTKDGLPDMVIYAILNDDDGNLWMSTNHGLSRFNPRTLVFRNFDVKDGLQDNEFNSCSYFKSASGELFFGGINGFNAFYPEDIRENPHAPPVVLTDFRIFNESTSFLAPSSPLKKTISETTELTLHHDQKVFSFEFAALDYTDPSKNQYAYKMEHFDVDWQQAGTSRSATYTNLDPGEYVFHVKGSNNDGVWNEEGTSINITILPPWWQTWWAYSLYVAFALAMLYTIRRYELNRIQLKNQARMEHLEAEKLRELDLMKSRFFANISHEFRTPLTLIMGQIDSMRSLLKDPALKTRLEMAFRNSRLLLRLINQLLDLSQLESGRMQLKVVHGNIVPLLKSLTSTFESFALNKGIDLRFQSVVKTIDMDNDPEKIEKIMHNLLSNAFKFTPEGGRIRVQLSVDGKQSLASQQLAGNCLVITVRDSGAGIPTKHLPHIFDRFYQADSAATRDPAHTGTGIGLALTKELVDLHGGEISVTSEEGFGTTFVVRLPLVSHQPSAVSDQPSKEGSDLVSPFEGGLSRMSEPDTWQPATSDQESEIQNPNSEIVLIVEDNADVRAYLRENLEAHFQIVEASDGEEGLANAMEQLPDLVITDVMMPKLDGYALSQKLREDEMTSHIPIIMLTARAEEADKITGLEIGVDDYLTKPFSPNEVQVRVRNLIAQRKKLRERFSQTLLISPSKVTVASMDQKFLQRLKEIVEANIENEDFELRALSAEAGMSERQLERKLKALIDQTPNQFVRSMRLQRAKQLLEQNAGTVSEIAYMVGFNNIPYFSKVFREAFGRPPSEFKGE